ncbi:MAG: sulfite exporter TauE/SafE family protein [Ignavibacteriae bacterium]|nr:sulfite exporter TauE/SafE family protein [Ignavibacteriota bacterium]
MTELNDLLLIILIGLLSGVANVFAEGGSILALPALILLGLPSAVANGTNRLALFVLNLFALKTFYNRDRVEFKKSVWMALFAVAGAILGAFGALMISDQTFNAALGVSLLVVAISMYMQPTDDLAPFASGAPPIWAVVVSMFAIGFYGGFIQSGVGLFLMIALSALFHSDEIKKSIHKISVVFAYLFPTSLIFLWTDNVEWSASLALLVGYMIGHWLATTAFIKRLERVLRVIMVISIVLMSLKLLRVF